MGKRKGLSKAFVQKLKVNDKNISHMMFKLDN